MAEWLPSIITGGSTIIAVLIAGIIANRYQKNQHTIKTSKTLTTEACRLLRKGVNLVSDSNKWFVLRTNKKIINQKKIAEIHEKIEYSIADFKIDLDILRNKMSIQLKISSENDKEINKIYESWRIFSKIISDDFLGDPVDNITDKLTDEMKKIVNGIYQIMNIIIRSKIRFRWRRIKTPLVQEK